MSVNTSSSFERRALAKLSKAGLIKTTTGKVGACRLAKDAKDISLLNIYKAVNAPKAFAIQLCGAKTLPRELAHQSRSGEGLRKTHRAMEASLNDTSLAQIVSDMVKEQT